MSGVERQPASTGNGEIVYPKLLNFIKSVTLDDPILPLVIEDLRIKVKQGYNKYKTVLKTENGRDPVKDMYQELLDALFYGIQAIMEYETDPTFIDRACEIIAPLILELREEIEENK